MFAWWFRHNTEKVIYFLLLDRKLKNPCDEDTEEVLNRSKTGTALQHMSQLSNKNNLMFNFV